MERLSVSNFLSIKEISIEIAPITIVIGPQASGKSVLAKLAYFFRSIFTDELRQLIAAEKTINDLNEALRDKFVRNFPTYGWRDLGFKILYENDNVSISIQNGQKGETLEIEISENLKSLISSTIDRYRKQVESLAVEDPEAATGNAPSIKLQLLSHSYTTLRLSMPDFFRSPIFIPASRSIYHIVQPNVFSLIGMKADFDHIFIKFAAIYEGTKKRYAAPRVPPRLPSEPSPRVYLEKIKQVRRSILCGDYLNENDQDWIQDSASRRKTLLANASSGQQEALPMLAVLSDYAFSPRIVYYIEEPEAHLFPTTQRLIVSLIGLLHKGRGQRFFLTTHSPYILTAFNILLATWNALSKKPKRKRKVPTFIDESTAIPFDDIAAYSLKDGEVTDILDRSARLIGSSVIDGVSDEFEQLFENILLWGDGEELS